jgi:hypothetical protein
VQDERVQQGGERRDLGDAAVPAAASRRPPPGRSRPPGVPRLRLQARGRRRRPGGRPCSLPGRSVRHRCISNQEGSPCRNDKRTFAPCPSSFGGGLQSRCSSRLRARGCRPAEVTSRRHGGCIRPSRSASAKPLFDYPGPLPGGGELRAGRRQARAFPLRGHRPDRKRRVARIRREWGASGGTWPVSASDGKLAWTSHSFQSATGSAQ